MENINISIEHKHTSPFAVVFMGSEKYPEENDFDAYVKKHGGGSNAYTDCERVWTCTLYNINIWVLDPLNILTM